MQEQWAWHSTLESSFDCVKYTEICMANLMTPAFILAEISVFIEIRTAEQIDR